MARQQSSKGISKKQEIREKRRKKERQTRILTIAAVFLVAVLVIAVLAAPSIRSSLAPVAEIQAITSRNWPQSNDRAIGNPDAKVVVEVYEDFKCSACQAYNQAIEPQVVENHALTGEIYYIFRSYPFLDDRSSIKDSDRAALAASCAMDQDRFWDYKSMLYTNLAYQPDEFNEKRLIAMADSLEMETAQFEQCLESKKYQEMIDEDIASGIQKNITGTPSVFVNGVQIKPGYVPAYEEIRSAIQEELNN